MYLSLSLSLYLSRSLSLAFFLVRSYVLITLIKCLKGHKSLGLLFYVNKEKWQEKYNLETLIFIIVLNSRCLCGGSLKLSYLVKT